MIDSWPPSVNPPKVCTVWHCFQSPSFLPWPFILTLSLWWKRCHVGGSASCCLCVLVGGHRLFFSGEWCLTHPSVALSCPVDSCYSLWRSQSLGPDEQGLIHLTGRFLPTSNHCRDKGRRWKVLWSDHTEFSRCVHIIMKPYWIVVPAVPSPWSTILLLEQML